MPEEMHPREETLHDYVDGLLAPEAAAAVAAHVASCAACRSEVATVEALAAALATVEEVPLGRDLSADVRRRIAAEGAGMADAGRRWLTLIWSLQGVVAVALLVVLWPAIAGWWTATNRVVAADAVAWQSRLVASLANWEAQLTGFVSAWQAPPALVEIPPDQLLLFLGLIVAVWLAGNGVLLRAPGSDRRLNGGSHG